MKLTPKIQKAISVSVEKHMEQVKKTEVMSYINHSFAMASMLNEYTDDEDVVCSGLLHDVLSEARGYGYAKLEKDFGWRVAVIIKEVSEDKESDIEASRKVMWKKKKMAYLEHLKKASKEALLVSAADKVQNLLTIVGVYENQRNKIWPKLTASAEQTLWFYGEFLKILEKSLKNRIVAYFRYVYGRAKTILKDK